LKIRRFFVTAFVLIFLFIASTASTSLKGFFFGLLRAPLVYSASCAQAGRDLFYFRRNARENEALRKALAESRSREFQNREILAENERLKRLLNLSRALPGSVKRAVVARVIAKSQSASACVVLIDKGAQQGIRANMIALSGSAVAGKVVEVWPGCAKVLLIKDPNCRIAVLVQRTRDEGVLYGISSSICVKYLPVDGVFNSNDVVETAGYGRFFPKGLPVGKVIRVWKEPGQIYQVAEIAPLSDLGRLEELVCVE